MNTYYINCYLTFLMFVLALIGSGYMIGIGFIFGYLTLGLISSCLGGLYLLFYEDYLEHEI